MQSSRFAAFDRRLAPIRDRARTAFLLGADIAHRGLHGPGIPENSLAAADAAIAAGLGIECDVRAGRDGVPMVFHDDDTRRLCGVPGRFEDAAPGTLRLADGSPVPSLADLLDRIAGRVALLVEIKTDDRPCDTLCRAVADTIRGRDAVAVMGFDPRVSRWFARHAPAVPHGLVMTERDEWRDPVRRRASVWWARPDFLSYDVRRLPSPLPAALRAGGMPILTWTVRTPAEFAVTAAHADRPTLERA